MNNYIFWIIILDIPAIYLLWKVFFGKKDKYKTFDKIIISIGFIFLIIFEAYLVYKNNSQDKIIKDIILPSLDCKIECKNRFSEYSKNYKNCYDVCLNNIIKK